jgi:small neutral amino acid transporter SnatA (MarC family)
MFEEYEKKKRKQIIFMKSLLDYGMGTIFLLFGLFFLFGEKLNIHWGGQMDTGLEKTFGGLCLAYAAWRIYRGYKKNYFR